MINFLSNIVLWLWAAWLFISSLLFFFLSLFHSSITYPPKIIYTLPHLWTTIKLYILELNGAQRPKTSASSSEKENEQLLEISLLRKKLQETESAMANIIAELGKVSSKKGGNQVGLVRKMFLEKKSLYIAWRIN